ncbi:MAG: hypothetical protein HPY74_15870 [Firmicutes bacterium]|nr:hypothetical protein [Bacillota bacterium]NSW92122.1 hypothetical protein [Bacillota bacterium]
MKKAFSIILTLCFILSLSVNALAVETNDEVTPKGYWEYWKIDDKKKNYDEEPIGNWELVYVGTPAKKPGETDTVTASLTRSAEVTGSIQVPVKQIAASVNVTLGVGYTVGGSRTSAPLDVGEYVKGYARPVASIHRVTQRKYIHMDGEDIPTSEIAYAYVKEPTAVTIRIEYYKSTKSLDNRSLNDKPHKVETFIIKNGICEKLYE